MNVVKEEKYHDTAADDENPHHQPLIVAMRQDCDSETNEGIQRLIQHFLWNSVVFRHLRPRSVRVVQHELGASLAWGGGAVNVIWTMTKAYGIILLRI